jgi:hypothetical protein
LIRREAVPEHALHAHYGRQGSYLDCYVTEIPATVNLAQFVEAFYSTWLFKIERWILSWAVRKPSTDTQAREIAQGRRDNFAEWTCEARGADQLLMRDFLAHTRSWFMVEPLGERSTRLYFGSVVTSKSRGYQAWLGFHKLYSRALLRTARTRLLRG